MSQNLSFPVISSTGSIDQYIQQVNAMPMLTEAQESDLAEKWQKQGDLEAARMLVLSHLRLVVAIARGYLGYGLPHADLIQEGNVGLMKAVKRFDPDRGVRLVSFAIHWIKAEIHEFIIRNWRLVKIATTKAQRKLFFNLRSMKKDLGAMTERDIHDVARRLDVKPEEVMEMEMRLNGCDVPMESSPADDDGAEQYYPAPAAYLADTHAGPLEVLAESEASRLQTEGLQQALGNLDARSRDIVTRRWLVEDGSSPPTLQELAAEYGVSAERIRQIEVKAMQKMRGFLTV